MPTFKHQLTEHLIELCWRQWTELGVAGARGGYTKAAISPEELLILTATVADADPRLRDEVLDWWTRYGEYVSKPRLKNLVKSAPAIAQKLFAPFAATAGHHTRTSWPGAGAANAIKTKLSGKSQLPNMKKPALLHLRLRAMFGINARTDILAAFLGTRHPFYSASDLAYLGYSKRNIAQTLEQLSLCGLLMRRPVKNALRFQWQRRDELEALLRPLPDRIPKWPLILSFVLGLQDLASRVDGQPDIVAGVEAVGMLQAHRETLLTLAAAPPEPGTEPEKLWLVFEKWALNHLDELEKGKSILLVGKL